MVEQLPNIYVENGESIHYEKTLESSQIKWVNLDIFGAASCSHNVSLKLKNESGKFRQTPPKKTE